MCAEGGRGAGYSVLTNSCWFLIAGHHGEGRCVPGGPCECWGGGGG